MFYFTNIYHGTNEKKGEKLTENKTDSNKRHI